MVCFKQRIAAIPTQHMSKSNLFLKMIGLDTGHSRSKDRMDVQVTEITGSSATNMCHINLATLGELVIFKLQFFRAKLLL